MKRCDRSDSCDRIANYRLSNYRYPSAAPVETGLNISSFMNEQATLEVEEVIIAYRPQSLQGGHTLTARQAASGRNNARPLLAGDSRFAEPMGHGR